MSGVALKPGVSCDGLQPEGAHICRVLDEIAAELNLTLTITCTTKDHAEPDPHTHGFAIDVRTLDLTSEQTVKVWRLASKRLGSDHYTVRYEVSAETFKTLTQELRDIASIGPVTAPHIHIQFRKGLWQTLVKQRATA